MQFLFTLLDAVWDRLNSKLFAKSLETLKRSFTKFFFYNPSPGFLEALIFTFATLLRPLEVLGKRIEGSSLTPVSLGNESKRGVLTKVFSDRVGRVASSWPLSVVPT